MLIPPNEHSLLLAERWLKLLSDLGRSQATLTAYRSALRHYFAFCSQRSIEPEKARFEDLAAYISPQLSLKPEGQNELLCTRSGRFQHQHALTGGEQILLHSYADSPESSRAFFRV